MKIKLIIILLLFNVISNAQFENKEFSDTTLWHMHSGFSWLDGPGGTLHEENINSYKIIINDTTINDTLYQKLYSCNFDFNNLTFDGFFKSINKKIYCGNNIDSMKLMYDYNLNVGDTFRFNSYNNPNEETSYLVEVILVDSIFANNRYRKRIQFDEFDDNGNFCSAHISVYWVEGFGDYNYGLISDYGLIMFCECQPLGNSSLQCFSENNISIIGNCQISTNISTIEGFNDFKIYPNPTNDNFSIKTNKIIISIEFYNVSGKKVKIIDLKQNHKNIDVSDLKTALYFYKAKVKDGTYFSGKILIK